MTQRHLALLIALGALAACASHDAPEGAADSVIAAATAAPPVAKNPHVKAFEIGRAVDSTNRITGGVLSNYHGSDTIFVSIRTEYVKEGADLGVRVLRGKGTVDSTGMKSGAPNAEGLAVVSTRFLPPAKGWPVGAYRAEVFLDGVSQGLVDFEVIK